MTHCEPDSGGVMAPGALHVALVGSPNAGKTTIFNSLTGLRAKTANYPGVTVTRREGAVEIDGVVVKDLVYKCAAGTLTVRVGKKWKKVLVG